VRRLFTGDVQAALATCEAAADEVDRGADLLFPRRVQRADVIATPIIGSRGLVHPPIICTTARKTYPVVVCRAWISSAPTSSGRGGPRLRRSGANWPTTPRPPTSS